MKLSIVSLQGIYLLLLGGNNVLPGALNAFDLVEIGCLIQFINLELFGELFVVRHVLLELVFGDIELVG
jgi:hypothetical protein